MLLSYIEEEWEGVTLEGFTGGAEADPVFAIDALIPPFAADPATYSRLVTAPALQTHHPFKNPRDRSAPQATTQARASALCVEFDNNVKHARGAYLEVDRPNGGTAKR